MTTVPTSAPQRATAPPSEGGHRRRRSRRTRERPNWVAGLTSVVWLAIVIVPIYWIVITSFKTQSNYYAENPFAPPGEPTIANYRLVIESDFPQYFLNSVIATIGAVIPAVLVSFMAAYAIVRGRRSRLLRWTNSLFQIGRAHV